MLWLFAVDQAWVAVSSIASSSGMPWSVGSKSTIISMAIEKRLVFGRRPMERRVWQK
uniref:Uncharacterized protein n=1 Tax=Hyaloperonospora arabidopsidis (strain Emoy2) TaxID=559515 RepID=M4B4B6_HYAAE